MTVFFERERVDLGGEGKPIKGFVVEGVRNLSITIKILSYVNIIDYLKPSEWFARVFPFPQNIFNLL